MANVKAGMTGALGGAAAGAALGPIGAGVGAGIGGLMGLFGGDDSTKPQMPPIVDPVTGAQLNQAADQTNSGLNQQQAFVNALQAQGGIQNQSQVYNQLQGIAAGTGPNPAQAMLAQATGANVANQAALMAGQRGAGANAGLMARQAAQQGAGIQQQAAGQGATMQAQQSLNAIGQAGGIAGQQVGQQANSLQNYNQFAQNNQGQLLGARGQYNNAITGAQGNVNSANQQEAGRNQAQMGGLLSGAGAAATALGGTKAPSDFNTTTGAFQPKFDPNTGDMTNGKLTDAMQGGAQAKAMGGEIAGPASFVGRHLSGKPQYAHGGKVDALVSPEERIVPKSKVTSKDPLSVGKKVPGKAKVKGNSYANDTVPKKLNAGDIVIPNSVTQSSDPHGNAAKFVAAILAKKSK